jgi:signal transduction histidine kinase
MVSHEIRTPLNAVNGATALLLDTKPLTQEQLELLELLDAGANHVVLIVEGALLLLTSRACVSVCSPRALADILLHGALNSGQFPVVTEPLTLTSSVLEPAWSGGVCASCLCCACTG